MIRTFVRAALAALLLSALPAAAAAEGRFALVVGNSGYRYAGIPALDNPAPDARLMAERLELAGFDVTLAVDLDLAGFRRTVAAFGRKLRQGGRDTTGLFYYAGHAVQSFGANYLLPVDTNLSDAADLDLVALEANAILRQMRSARNRTNIFILDACRNNPFETVPGLDESGLAEMRAPPGTFLAYATGPGEVALDGQGGNSPYTRAIAEAMMAPGTPIEQMFRQVRVDVIEATLGQQTPWDTSLLTREFTFFAAEEAPEEPAKQLWNSVRTTRDPVQVALFLKAYPDSMYAPTARGLMEDLLGPSSGDEPTLTFEPVTPEDEPVAAAPSVGEIAAAGGDAATARRDEPAVASAPAPAPTRAQTVGSGAADRGQNVARARRSSPSEDERAALEAARADGTAAAYRAFLDAYPDGVFRELATVELAALPQPVAPGPAAIVAAQVSRNVEAEAEPAPDPAPATVAAAEPQAPTDPAAESPAHAPAADRSLVREAAAFEAAQAEATRAAYEAFLDEHPDSVFAGVARAALAALPDAALEEAVADAADEALDERVTVAQAPAARAAASAVGAAADAAGSDAQTVRFDTPITSGDNRVSGKTILQVLEESPRYPPIPGLPESYWVDQTCSNCHQWNRTDLCTQAQTYVTSAREELMLKPHPFGGDVKQHLQAWAQGGCG